MTGLLTVLPVDMVLPLSLVMPLGGMLLVLLCGRMPNLREAMSLATGVALLYTVSVIASHTFDGESLRWILAEPFAGFQIAFSAEPLGAVFALLASFLWIVTTVYAIGYMRGHKEQNQTRFYAFFAISISGVMGVAFADNLLTLFIFYEVLTLATYPLVTHAGTADARKGGRVYLGILIGTSMLFFLLAILWTAIEAGSLKFAAGGIFSEEAPALTLSILLALYVFGIGKAAIMPFHRWLPAAMVAPTPVSALLHAVAVVKAGVFSVLKIVIYVFGVDTLASIPSASWLAWLAGFTILAASLVAMRKDNLKARLAYSTVSQLSYVILGALLANNAAITGAAMHIVAHGVGKITLFFCAGAILVAAHRKNVSELDGLGSRMPFTFAAFFVGALSIAGLPPAVGVWSKWYLALGTVDAGEFLLLAVLLVSTLLNVWYLLEIPVRAFFKPARAEVDNSGISEAPTPSLIAIGITTACCIVFFVYPDPIYFAATSLVSGW